MTYQFSTYRQISYNRLLSYLTLILLLISSNNVFGDGGPAVESNYEGEPLLIPLIDYSPKIDGVTSDNEYPQQGHIALPGLLEEVKISHNNTALFVSITVDAEEFVGIATLSRGGHSSGITEFAYFLVGINAENQTETSIRIANNEYESPTTVINAKRSIIADVKQVDDARVYEMMIPIIGNEQVADHENSASHDPIEDLIPRSGAMFNLMIINGEGDDISSTNVNKSPIVPAYLLREGENPDEIAKLLDNNPDWVEALLLPLILFTLSLYFVWKYKLIPNKKGGN